MFGIACVREKEGALVWLFVFALSSSVYSFTFIALYWDGLPYARDIMEWGFLLGYVTYISYLICLYNYFGKKSLLKKGLISVNMLFMAAYGMLLIAGIMSGESFLILERQEPIVNKLLPFDFIEKYTLSQYTNLSHMVARVNVIAFLLIMMFKNEMSKDPFIQAGVILSLLIMAHNWYSVNFNVAYYLPLLPFMNFIELTRFSWLMAHKKDVVIGQYRERLDSYDEGLEKHLKLKKLGQNTASIIHDLSNPAAVILGNAQLLEREAKKYKAPARVMKRIEAIVKASDRLISMLYARKSDLMISDEENIHVSVVLSDAMEMIEQRKTSNNILLEVKIEHDLLVKVNRSDLLRVFVNLLNNSCDAVSELEEKWIKIKTFGTEDTYTVSISNAGPPIPEEIQYKLMTPFFSTKKLSGGSGMGLNICQEYLEQMNARLALNSNSNHPDFHVIFNKEKSQRTEKSS